jgi:hypothetical protein
MNFGDGGVYYGVEYGVDNSAYCYQCNMEIASDWSSECTQREVACSVLSRVGVTVAVDDNPAESLT